MPVVVLRNAQKLVASFGPLRAALYAVHRLLERISGGRARIVCYRFVAQPIAPVAMPATRGTGSVELRWLEPDDGILQQVPRPPTVLARRFRDGARCLAAIKAGRLVGFLWYQQGSYLEDEVRCRYLFDSRLAVWDFDVYIDPAYRLSRLFARLWSTAQQELAQHGFRWTLSRISVFNPASLAAHARIGARPLASATFLVCGRFQLSFATIAPHIHASLRADRYPEFRLCTPAEPEHSDASGGK